MHYLILPNMYNYVYLRPALKITQLHSWWSLLNDIRCPWSISSFFFILEVFAVNWNYSLSNMYLAIYLFIPLSINVSIYIYIYLCIYLLSDYQFIRQWQTSESLFCFVGTWFSWRTAESSSRRDTSSSSLNSCPHTHNHLLLSIAKLLLDW